MTIGRFTNPVPQYLDDAGDPLVNGKLYFFESGTNTPKATFADVNHLVANTHPVTLNGDGTTPNIFYSGAAKVVRTDSDDVQSWSRDPVSTGGDSGTVGDDWNAISIYSINSVVDLNGVLYVSIINNNQNNNPSTTATAWTEWDLLKRWNTNETYSEGDPVTASNGSIYTSVIDNNLGDNPTLNSGNWSFPQTTGRNRNVLINANFEVNQRSFGGGQPAIGVYGFDRWKGDSAGTRIEQVVENTETINEAYVISWVGGSGTADVNGVTGLSSGDSFTLNTSGNYSVIVPTDATRIKLEFGLNSTAFTTAGNGIGEEFALCQRYYQTTDRMRVRGGLRSSGGSLQHALVMTLAVEMRATPSETHTFSTNGGTWTEETFVVTVNSVEATADCTAEAANNFAQFTNIKLTAEL